MGIAQYLVDELEDSALEQLIASTQDQLASISNEYENRVRSIRNEYSEMKNNELNNSGQDIPPYLQPVPSFMDNYSVRELGWIALGATWWIDSVRSISFIKWVLIKSSPSTAFSPSWHINVSNNCDMSFSD